MIDFDLARKFLNSAQKELINIRVNNTDIAVDEGLKSVIGKLDLLYDILHLSELDIINVNTKHL